jgi:predicted amino acid racemase
VIAPRIEIDLGAIEDNAKALVTRLGERGIGVTGVTKATLGSPDVAKAMLRGGVKRIGDSRLENLEALAAAGVREPLVLLRSPTPEQADRTVAVATVSLVSELEVALALSAAAGRIARNHGIVLMVELGDLREGVMVADVLDVARRISRMPHLTLVGIGANLACRSGVIPGDDQMRELSAQATVLSTRLGMPLPFVSGGNSANLSWALGRGHVGAITDLRLGEAILLGVDPLTRTPLEGLRTDAFAVVGAVIESREKPVTPWGVTAQSAFGLPAPAALGSPLARGVPPRAQPRDRSTQVQTLVALGRQDIDPEGLTAPAGVTVLAASSDHLVLETSAVLAPGTELRFGVDYSALLRAMTSPFVVERLVQAAVPVR